MGLKKKKKQKANFKLLDSFVFIHFSVVHLSGQYVPNSLISAKKYEAGDSWWRTENIDGRWRSVCFAEEETVKGSPDSLILSFNYQLSLLLESIL